jgi:hypothetical protein
MARTEYGLTAVEDLMNLIGLKDQECINNIEGGNMIS